MSSEDISSSEIAFGLHQNKVDNPELEPNEPQEAGESTSLSGPEAKEIRTEGVEQSEPTNMFGCDLCGQSFKSAFALKGHTKKHSNEKKQVMIAQSEEIAKLKEDLAREETARKLAEEQVKKLKASRELSAMQAQGTIDPVDAAITRLVKLKELEALGGSNGNAPATNYESNKNGAISERLRNLEQELKEERHQRLERERADTLKREILFEVNNSLAPVNAKIDELNRKLSEQPRSTDFLTASIQELGRTVQRSQENIGAVAKSLLQEPTEPVFGATRNDQIERLEDAGLVDHDKTGSVLSQRRTQFP